MKGKIVFGVDLVFWIGCKFVVLDEIGKVLKIDVIYLYVLVNKMKEVYEKVKVIFE